VARPKTPANSPGTRERAVAIENILCRYSTSSEGLSIDEILELLETEYDIVATERSVREQLKTLVAMSDEGKLMRTISRQEGKGRRVRWIADQIFSEAELRLIADGLTMARLKNDDLLGIIKKLQELAGDASGRTISHVKRYGQERGMVAHVSLGTIVSLIDAIERRRVVRIAYTHRETDGSLAPNLDDAGTEKSYLLEPYQLAFKNGHYYLICRPHDGALAVGHPWYLRVDHIADVRATRRRFDAPASNVELGGDHFDAVSHMDEMAYPLGGRVEHVRVRTTLLDAIYDWYPTASVRRVGMGDAQEPVYEAEFDTVLLPTCWWALQYAEYVEVLGPQALRDMIAQSVRTLERTYDIEPEARPSEARPSEAQHSEAGQNDPRHSDPRQSDQKR